MTQMEIEEILKNMTSENRKTFYEKSAPIRMEYRKFLGELWEEYTSSMKEAELIKQNALMIHKERMLTKNDAFLKECSNILLKMQKDESIITKAV